MLKNLTTNQIMLICGGIVILIFAILFFRKKPDTTRSMGTTPPKETPESGYSSIPGTKPFNQTFMKPNTLRNEQLAMMDAITV